MDQNKIRWVDLLSYDAGKGDSVVVARCVLQDKNVEILTDRPGLAEFLAGGLPLAGGGTVKPEDGEAFLGALLKELRTPYLLASDMQVGDAMPGWPPTP